MATKKPKPTSGKLSRKGISSYVHVAGRSLATETSASAEPAGEFLAVKRYSGPATRRAIEILKPYEPSYKSARAKLTAIQMGLESHAISDLIEITGATQSDVAQILDLTEPTLRKHIKAGKELNTGLSEHILQLFQLFDKGMDTFGSLEEFKTWLGYESIALSARPMDVLDTITGINMVMDELVRIDYGITV
jgi:putative toxin-antitoxin system antitoxin component (TIGR02293 family)